MVNAESHRQHKLRYVIVTTSARSKTVKGTV